MRRSPSCHHSLCGLLIIFLFVPLTSYPQQANPEPTLPLPEMTPELNQLKSWPPGRPMANSIRAFHYNPEMVMPLLEVGQSLGETELGWKTHTMLTALVSSVNGCRYCLCSAVNILRGEGLSDSAIIELQNDVAQSSFPKKEKALLTLARELTVDPASSPTYVTQALDAGWSKNEVAQAIFIISYFNMLNRIAEAFGLPPDESHPYDPDGKLPMTECRESEKHSNNEKCEDTD